MLGEEAIQRGQGFVVHPHVLPSTDCPQLSNNGRRAAKDIKLNLSSMVATSKFIERQRMNLMANHGVDKLGFELWSLAVSAINGCRRCLESHEQVLVKAGASRETVQEAVKIAAIVNSVAVTLEAEDSLA